MTVQERKESSEDRASLTLSKEIRRRCASTLPRAWGGSLFLINLEQRGDNYVRQLGVDLEGLYTGITKTVKLHKRIICPTCNGLGT